MTAGGMTAAALGVYIALEDEAGFSDAQLEAAGLLAMSAGLGTSLLLGQRSPESAIAVLDHHLNRIFRTGDAAS